MIVHEDVAQAVRLEIYRVILCPLTYAFTEENRQQLSSRSRYENHDNLITMVVVPQTDPENTSHKSRFRSIKSVGVTRNLRERGRKESFEATDKPSSPSLFTKDFTKPVDDNEEFEMPLSPMTPHASTSSDPPNIFSSASDEFIDTSPAVHHPVAPDTPYDPLQTPSFRHSPPRLPSDQPWLYPSPSHPLHLRTPELSLSMLVPNDPSPITRGVNSEGSPLTVHSSPLSKAGPSAEFVETPATSKSSFPKPFTKLFRIPTPSPLSFGTEVHSCGTSSPFTLALRSGPVRQRKRPLDISEGWENYFVSSDTSLGSINNDPFAVYSSWFLTEDRVVSPVRNPKPSDFDSPILRTGSPTTAVGLGIGLLDPFMFPREEPLSDATDIDLKEILSSPCSKQDERLNGKRTAPMLLTMGNSPPEPGPAKKRRITS